MIGFNLMSVAGGRCDMMRIGVVWHLHDLSSALHMATV